MRFCDLGPLEVVVEGSRVTARGARLNAVLATLLLHLNRRVSTDLLLDAVGGDAATESSHSTDLGVQLRPRRPACRPSAGGFPPHGTLLRRPDGGVWPADHRRPFAWQARERSGDAD